MEALTFSCGREMLAIDHSTVSPLHMNVPAASPLAGVSCHDILSFVTVEFARASTAAYRLVPSGRSWMSCPLVIWNCAAVEGSPSTASDAVFATSDRRYWWKFGSSCVAYVHMRGRGDIS